MARRRRRTGVMRPHTAIRRVVTFNGPIKRLYELASISAFSGFSKPINGTNPARLKLDRTGN